MIRRALTLLLTALAGVTTTLAVGPTNGPSVPEPRPLPGPSAQPNGEIVTYAPPVPGRTVRGFELPRTRFGAGHRGVDLETVPGETVRADGAGTVSFAGSVAGRGVVVISHPDGIRTEFEPVEPLLKSGAKVTLGVPIATVDGTHDSCPFGGCLHWSARRADQYFDPLTLLAPLGPVRLVPWTDN